MLSEISNQDSSAPVGSESHRQQEFLELLEIFLFHDENASGISIVNLSPLASYISISLNVEISKVSSLPWQAELAHCAVTHISSESRSTSSVGYFSAILLENSNSSSSVTSALGGL